MRYALRDVYLGAVMHVMFEICVSVIASSRDKIVRSSKRHVSDNDDLFTRILNP